ncbi:MAG: hypothetical protein WC644_09055 [Ignavibacteria bacterium]
MQRYIKVTIFLLSLILLSSCNKKEESTNQQNSSSGEFVWKESISVKDIPDAPLKGKIEGKDFNPVYIVFEKWRGSNDNVLAFSDKAPKNKCGFIENYNGYQLTKIGSEFKVGEFVKDSFVKSLEGYSADFHVTENDDMRKINASWNASLLITEMNDDVVKGRIAMCFKDEKKSWIAGRFEAIVCNN